MTKKKRQRVFNRRRRAAQDIVLIVGRILLRTDTRNHGHWSRFLSHFHDWNGDFYSRRPFAEQRGPC